MFFLIVRGDQIINLELVDVDEVNLNAVLLIGGQCLNLQKFCLHGCHFQMQPEDASAVDALCREKLVCGREPGISLLDNAPNKVVGCIIQKRS